MYNLQLKRNPYLIYSDPDNTRAIMNNFKCLCGMDIKIVVNKHPKIVLSSWKTIEQIKNHVEVIFYDFNTINLNLNKIVKYILVSIYLGINYYLIRITYILIPR